MLIHIRDSDTSLALILSDNGQGFNIESLKRGMGLKNIESRLHSINALSKWKSERDKGTRLIIVHQNL